MILGVSFLILMLGVFMQGVVFGMAKERIEWMKLTDTDRKVRARNLYPKDRE